MIHIGFTGTQNGMTDAQNERLVLTMASLEGSYCIHHGDCIGADAEFHDICDGLDGFIGAHVYPCNIDNKRAHVSHEVISTKPAKPPLDRNHDIVDACDVLVATPKTFNEEIRSGTWATIRYARKAGKPVLIVWPDGTISGDSV